MIFYLYGLLAPPITRRFGFTQRKPNSPPALHLVFYQLATNTRCGVWRCRVRLSGGVQPLPVSAAR
ncbi:hypothetical protein CH49_4300 (plasmid) [Yersinia enterocolitica]|uniref:Uncharacterized protein n=2 Tax=Yersinia enterocolitica TaxID=630 RepID=Q93KQ9_YEREN|nr:unknown [Yersinia enterocolitica]AJJ21442.1 hypothetical protein CH49_4300 [Yersinia enterocolitica]CAL10094.1 hypothetical protein YEP0074 [Yersinia enterocolitica subsp. enterocolitica 8081]